MSPVVLHSVVLHLLLRATDVAAAATQPATFPALFEAASLTSEGIEQIHLSEAVERALARNPSIRAASADVQRVDGLLEQTRSLALPTLAFNALYTRLDDDRRLNGNVISGKNQLSGNVTALVPLIAPQRWANWYRASLQLDATAASRDDVRRSIAVTTVRAYFAVMTDRRFIEAQEQARVYAKVSLDYARQRFLRGLGSRLDVARAEREAETLEAQLHASYAALAKAREALGVMVAADAPIDVFVDETLQVPGTLQSALGNAEELRADVRAARVRVWAATKSASANWTDYAPLITASFQPFYQNPPTLTFPLWGWQAFVTLSWQVYDGGMRYGQGRERDALQAQAELVYEATRRQALSDVRGAYVGYARALRAQQAAKKALAAAELGLQLATAAYRTGVITGLELIDAQRAERDAATFAASVDDSERQAALDVLAASGSFP